MKQISPELKSHLAGELTTLVTCWVLTRQDGVRMAFTTHDREIDFDNLTFRPVTSFIPSAVSSTNGLNVDNMEVSAALSSEGLAEKDIRAGLLDYAAISIFQLNWQVPEQGKLPIRRGWLGEFTLKDTYFTVEIRGLTQKLQQSVGDVFSPECRADLGSDNCHVNLGKFSTLSKVTSVQTSDAFTDDGRIEADGWYNYGILRWVSGGNAGLKMEIKTFAAGQFVMCDRPPKPVAAGDIYLAVSGCDKRSVTCKTKFQNFDNFRGETAIPGTDSLYNYPGLP